MNENVCMATNWFNLTVIVVLLIVMILMYLAYALGEDVGKTKGRKEERGF